MKAALIVTSSGPVPGREKKAIEYFHEVNDFFGKLATEGKTTEPEWFVSPRGRTFWFVKGEYETIGGLLTLPKVQEFIFQGGYLNREFEYEIAPVGTDEFIHAFQEVGVKLGFI